MSLLNKVVLSVLKTTIEHTHVTEPMEQFGCYLPPPLNHAAEICNSNYNEIITHSEWWHLIAKPSSDVIHSAVHWALNPAVLEQLLSLHLLLLLLHLF